MLKAIYFFLALAAIGVLIWQFGSVLGIPGAPERADTTIALSALGAAIIFIGLWYARIVNREKLQAKVLHE